MDRFVKLLDVMGSDADVANAARVSSGGDVSKRSEEDNKRLINYLMKNRHTSPFEMVELKFWVSCPIFIARQWVRHRTASINEISGRYSKLGDKYYLPDLNRLETQDKENKQKSAPAGYTKSERLDILNRIEDVCENAFDAYKHFLNDEINEPLSRELARIVLPLGTYTQFIWKIDLHNLFNFIKLRNHPHAQQEIQEYAEYIEELVSEKFPMCYYAWVEYVRDAVTFSSSEMYLLKCCNVGSYIKQCIDSRVDAYHGEPVSAKVEKELLKKLINY